MESTPQELHIATEEKRMKNIYLASVNPMHFSHLNTFLEAQRRLGEVVYLCIVHNPLKDEGIFSTKERADIANRFYDIPIEQIVTLSDKNEIISAIRNSQVIVRGVRDEADINEIKKLVEHFGVQGDFDKGLFITVPENMKQISSSRLVEKIKRGEYRSDDNWIPPELLPVIEDKLKNQFEQIKGAAMRYKGRLFLAKFHIECIPKIAEFDPKFRIEDIEWQGYETSTGRLVSMPEGKTIELKNGRVKEYKNNQ